MVHKPNLHLNPSPYTGGLMGVIHSFLYWHLDNLPTVSLPGVLFGLMELTNSLPEMGFFFASAYCIRYLGYVTCMSIGCLAYGVRLVYILRNDKDIWRNGDDLYVHRVYRLSGIRLAYILCNNNGIYVHEVSSNGGRLMYMWRNDIHMT